MQIRFGTREKKCGVARMSCSEAFVACSGQDDGQTLTRNEPLCFGFRDAKKHMRIPCTMLYAEITQKVSLAKSTARK